MPPTSVDMSPSLWISLDGRGTDTPFAPGDVIIGYVHRAAHLVGLELLRLNLTRGRITRKGG